MDERARLLKDYMSQYRNAKTLDEISQYRDLIENLFLDVLDHVDAMAADLAALKAKISPAENEAYEIINLLSSGQPNKYKYTDQTGWGLYFWWDVAKQDMQRVFEALKGGE